MPVLSVNRASLFKRLGREFSDEEFTKLCFEYGLELDDVTSERKMALNETGVLDESLSDEVIYKIEIPANRYDLLSLEGFSRAISIYLGNLSREPEYKTVKGNLQIHVSKEVQGIRPIVVCAVLRNVSLTQESFKSFIDLQEKLHLTLCRRRFYASVGTHDLDTIEGPFEYTAVPPSELKFVALNKTKEMNGEELIKDLESDTHLGKYLHMVKGKPLLPVIKDKNGVVLSFPPIINGNHSKMSANTKNVFIEVTATDRTKALQVLNILLCAHSEYCAEPFVVETVDTIEVDGSVATHPKFITRKLQTTTDYINSLIGHALPKEEIPKILAKMGLPAVLVEPSTIEVSVTPSRSDIMHPCDLVEDVAIAFGYNNLTARLPSTSTIAKQQPINVWTEKLRIEAAHAGFTELLTFVLVSRAENFAHCLLADESSAISVSEPKTAEFQIARTHLLPGILKTLYYNKELPLPHRVFEVSDVVRKNPETEVGSSNRRHLAAVYSDVSSGFEIVHGLLDHVMLSLNVKWHLEAKGGEATTYELRESQHSFFLPDAQADVVVKRSTGESKVGYIGILSPEVLKNFGLAIPISFFEIDVEALVC